MSAELYTSAQALAEVIEVPVDTHCQARIVCLDAPVGVATGDGNVNNRYYPTAVVSASSGDNPVLMCEDCHEWLREAYAARIAAVEAEAGFLRGALENIHSECDLFSPPTPEWLPVSFWRAVQSIAAAALAASPTPTGPTEGDSNAR